MISYDISSLSYLGPEIKDGAEWPGGVRGVIASVSKRSQAGGEELPMGKIVEQRGGHELRTDVGRRVPEGKRERICACLQEVEDGNRLLLLRGGIFSFPLHLSPFDFLLCNLAPCRKLRQRLRKRVRSSPCGGNSEPQGHQLG